MFEELGKRLRRRRKQLRLSRKAVALAAGASEQLIGNWERGICDDIGLKRLAPAARKLGCSIDYLATGKGAPQDSPPFEELAPPAHDEMPTIDVDVLERAIEELLGKAASITRRKIQFIPSLAPALAAAYSALAAGKSVTDPMVVQALRAIAQAQGVKKGS